MRTGSGEKEIRGIWSVGGTRDACLLAAWLSGGPKPAGEWGGALPDPAHAHAARMCHSPVPPTSSLAVDVRLSPQPHLPPGKQWVLFLCPRLVAGREAGTQSAVE